MLPDRRQRLDAFGVCVEGAMSGVEGLGVQSAILNRDDRDVAVEFV